MMISSTSAPDLSFPHSFQVPSNLPLLSSSQLELCPAITFPLYLVHTSISTLPVKHSSFFFTLPVEHVSCSTLPPPMKFVCLVSTYPLLPRPNLCLWGFAKMGAADFLDSVLVAMFHK